MSNHSFEDEHMWQQANVLSRSGLYSGWHEIESELIARGYDRARHLFSGRRVRDRLNRECAEAKKKLLLSGKRRGLE